MQNSLQKVLRCPAYIALWVQDHSFIKNGENDSLLKFKVYNVLPPSRLHNLLWIQSTTDGSSLAAPESTLSPRDPTIPMHTSDRLGENLRGLIRQGISNLVEEQGICSRGLTGIGMKDPWSPSRCKRGATGFLSETWSGCCENSCWGINWYW